MDIPDRIEREMILNAPIQKVWDAITNPVSLTQWFGDRADIPKLAEGEPLTFGWDDDVCKGMIQTVREPNIFAFRWQSSRLGKTAEFDERYTTLVTYTLKSVPEGTHLHMLETGFARLPEAISGVAHDDNTSGWTIELQELESEQPLSILKNPVSQPVDSPDKLTYGNIATKPSHGEIAHKDNVWGWEIEFDELKAFIEAGA